MVKENDKVEEGDIIAVVDSDKASIEVEVFESGTILKLLYKEKEEAHVLEPIAYIGKPGEDFDSDDNVDDKRIAKKIEIPEHSEEKKEKLSVYKQRSRIFATPAAKRVANINNIDLSVVMGTGPGGRIVKNDVLAQVENEEAGSGEGKYHGETFSKMRRKIAERMVRSKQTIPHFYLFTEVDMTWALEQRTDFNQISQDKVSINDLLIKDSAETLGEFPRINSHIEEDRIIHNDEIHTLSLACDHRGVDGVYAARFLEKMKNNLEQIQIGNAK